MSQHPDVWTIRTSTRYMKLQYALLHVFCAAKLVDPDAVKLLLAVSDAQLGGVYRMGLERASDFDFSTTSSCELTTERLREELLVSYLSGPKSRDVA